ncbi:hypothetical protein BC829DRAFT_400668 [Chytridium lagenaria]|nr:hypothetical protein BC829DRAFT_400668 [Chytridium lagenaria]
MFSYLPALAVWTALLVACALPSVTAHGMLVSPNGFGSSGVGSVRDYYKVNYQINDLRNPTYQGDICRRTGRSSNPTPVYMSNGGYHSVVLAFSVGFLMPLTTLVAPPLPTLAVPNGCTIPRGNDVVPYINTNSYSGASSQCGGYLAPGTENTNDMCAFQWTFQVQRLNEVNCRNCVMRWWWRATHLSNPEFYENCVDIRLSADGRNMGEDSALLRQASGSSASPSNHYVPAANVAALSAKVYERVPFDVIANMQLQREAQMGVKETLGRGLRRRERPLMEVLGKATSALRRRGVEAGRRMGAMARRAVTRNEQE